MEQFSELDLVVGSMITVSPDEGSKAYEEEVEWVSDVQELLKEQGVDVDLLSRPGVEVWEGGIQSFYDLYQLRRLAAHLETGNIISFDELEKKDEGEDVDNLLAAIWDEESSTKFPHLIKHQGDGGYYLPASFPASLPEPIWIDYSDEEEEAELLEEEPAFSFGSSIELLNELTEIEQLAAKSAIPQGRWHTALITLQTACQQSIQHKLPIILW